MLLCSEIWIILLQIMLQIRPQSNFKESPGTAWFRETFLVDLIY